MPQAKARLNLLQLFLSVSQNSENWQSCLYANGLAEQQET
jgi:hypothetical protein